MLILAVLLSLVAASQNVNSGNPLVGADKRPNVKLTARGQCWDYENDKIFGVNLGGWFVTEPYITPSLYNTWRKPNDDSDVPVDEYHLCQKLGKDACFQLLSKHWLLWYTEDDFRSIHEAGLNFVRIPIGHWAFRVKDGEPYVQGQQQYLNQALQWARKYGLKAWIDLHTAPGSQNGFDNSGLRDQIKFPQDDNIEFTFTVLDDIFKTYGHADWEDVVVGIELLNEPLGPMMDMNKLKQFYYAAYWKARNLLKLQTPIVIHDAFQQSDYWANDFKDDQYVHNVVMDHHHYQAFSHGELSRSIDEHIKAACQWGLDSMKEPHWSVCGEWLAALTDCAFWLNGVNRGARMLGDFDGSSYIDSCSHYWTIDNFSDQHRRNTRRYIEAQLDAFEKKGGWIFWNWKCENADEWDFRRLMQAGLFPQPLNDRQYPNQCQF